jgi:hypothetical protein
MISFCVRERWIRSFVEGQGWDSDKDWEESQPDPMENFFSALATVYRKIFSAFAVKELACNNVIPYGFGDIGDSIETGLAWVVEVG